MAGDPVALTRAEEVAGHRYITQTKHLELGTFQMPLSNGLTQTYRHVPSREEIGAQAGCHQLAHLAF